MNHTRSRLAPLSILLCAGLADAQTTALPPTPPREVPPGSRLTSVAENLGWAHIGEELLVGWKREGLGIDLNGDGDTLDRVLEVTVLSTGEVINVGLASSPAYNGGPLFAVDGPRVLLVVDEEYQGATDLNGDGDALDLVLHAYDTSTGIVHNTGLAVAWQAESLRIAGSLFACYVIENAQGATDLNQDGDTNDWVLAHGELGRQTTITAYSSTFEFSLDLHGRRLVGLTTERSYFETSLGGIDLNGDGDVGDRLFVVIENGTETLLPWSIVNDARIIDGDALLVVHEAGQGVDLNADNDTQDFVLQIYEPSSTSYRNLGLTTTSQVIEEGELLAFTVRESAQGATDFNGDGDTLDEVPFLFDRATWTSTAVPFACTPAITLQGGRLGFGVVESAQGSGSLNADGDTADVVAHVYTASSGAVLNAGVHGSTFVLRGRLLTLAVSEDNESSDLNGDDDKLDQVLHSLWMSADGTTGTLRNHAMACSPLSLSTAPGMAGFLAREASQGKRDLNGDGDDEDDVAMVIHARSGRLRNLRLAGGNSVRSSAPLDALPFTIFEFYSGNQDLNGDGDANDALVMLFE